MWYEGTFCAKVAVSHRVHVEVHTFVDVFVEGCTVVPILGIEAGFGALLVVELGTRVRVRGKLCVVPPKHHRVNKRRGDSPLEWNTRAHVSRKGHVSTKLTAREHAIIPGRRV